MKTCSDCGARDLGSPRGMNHAAGCMSGIEESYECECHACVKVRSKREKGEADRVIEMKYLLRKGIEIEFYHDCATATDGCVFCSWADEVEEFLGIGVAS